MSITVLKRDGRKVEFDRNRISNAILKAMEEVNQVNTTLLSGITDMVAGKLEADQTYSVDDIQKFVENGLMQSGMEDVARAYIIYRDKRDRARKSSSNQVIDDIVAARKTEVTLENANMTSYSPAGMMMKIASERSKEYVDEVLLSRDVVKAVRDNILHVHDKDYYPSRSETCVQSPIDRILEDGFVAGHGESRGAKRIETASILAAVSLQTTQNEQHGGQAIPAFDFYMAPYVRKTYIEEINKIEEFTGDNLEALRNESVTEYEYASVNGIIGTIQRAKQHAINMTVHRVHQSMEAFIHNMNTIHSRGGNQVVFSSINFGTDTSAEGRCVIRELLNSTYKGVGNGSTAIFPISILKLKRGVNKEPGDPNYDLTELAYKVTAKRFFPNFLNLDATFNQNPDWNAEDPRRFEQEVSTMGCVDGRELITYRVSKHEATVATFEDFWNHMSELFVTRKQSDLLMPIADELEDTQEPNIPEEAPDAPSDGNENVTPGDTEEEIKDAIETVDGDEYIQLDAGEYMDLFGVEIFDCGKFVECSRIIKNPDKADWWVVRLDDGRVLTCTADHPWSINGKVVRTEELEEGMPVKTGVNGHAKVFSKTFLGERNASSYDVTTETEHFTVSGIRSHNCRTRVYENRHGKSTSIGRGNLSFSTINLPGLALRVRNIEDKNVRIGRFFELLVKALNITSKQLRERYEFQCQAMAKQFPLLMSGMWVGSENLKPEDEVRPVLKHGTLGVGFIGLAECLVALIGKHHGESEEAQELGLKIVDAMWQFTKEESDKYDLNFSVLATPAEGLSGKFTKKDKKMFGVIPGVTDREYYTNSNHVPVYYKCSAAHKAKIEGPYHNMTRGGHIFYVELDGDATHNVQAVEDVVKLMDKYNIGYGSINHNRNRCMDCGYEDASKNLQVCPKCGGTHIDKLQRITGYLVGTTDRWNSGKLAELNDRVTHD